MARSTPRTWVYNELVTSAIMNLDIRDMFNAYWPFTTVGDIAYASAADALTRLGIGSAGQALLTNAGANAPEWGDVATELIAKRQGGHASDWWTQGTTGYTPSGAKIQVGVRRFTFTGGTSDAITITFPEAFGNIPIIFIGDGTKLVSGSLGTYRRFYVGVPTANDVAVTMSLGAGSTVVFDVGWMAIGV